MVLGKVTASAAVYEQAKLLLQKVQKESLAALLLLLSEEFQCTFLARFCFSSVTLTMCGLLFVVSAVPSQPNPKT